MYILMTLEDDAARGVGMAAETNVSLQIFIGFVHVIELGAYG